MPRSEIDGRRIDYDGTLRRWRWFDTGELLDPEVEAAHFAGETAEEEQPVEESEAPAKKGKGK